MNEQMVRLRGLISVLFDLILKMHTLAICMACTALLRLESLDRRDQRTCNNHKNTVNNHTKNEVLQFKSIFLFTQLLWYWRRHFPCPQYGPGTTCHYGQWFQTGFSFPMSFPNTFYLSNHWLDHALWVGWVLPDFLKEAVWNWPVSCVWLQVCIKCVIMDWTADQWFWLCGCREIRDARLLWFGRGWKAKDKNYHN